MQREKRKESIEDVWGMRDKDWGEIMASVDDKEEDFNM